MKCTVVEISSRTAFLDMCFGVSRVSKATSYLAQVAERHLISMILHHVTEKKAP